jgi:hypothetical protein
MSRPEKKHHSVIVLGALIFAAYFFVAAQPLGKELSFVPAWVASTTADVQPDPAAGQKIEGDLRPFTLGSRSGYFTPDGALPLCFDNSAGRAVSPGFYETADSTAGKHQFISPDASLKFSANADGIAQFKSGRLFFFNPDNTGVAEFLPTGSFAWKRDFASVLTVFDASRDTFVAGSINGELSILSKKGTPLYEFAPGGSRLPVILGAALSADGRLAASVSGIDPQRFILYERRGQGYKIVYHQYLASDFRRHVPIKVSADNRYVFYEQPGAVAVFDTRTRVTKRVPTQGRLCSVLTEGPRGLVCLLTSGGKGAHFIAIKPLDTVVMDVQFAGTAFFADCSGDSVFLGCDGNLVRVDVKEE